MAAFYIADKLNYVNDVTMKLYSNMLKVFKKSLRRFIDLELYVDFVFIKPHFNLRILNLLMLSTQYLPSKDAEKQKVK